MYPVAIWMCFLRDHRREAQHAEDYAVCLDGIRQVQTQLLHPRPVFTSRLPSMLAVVARRDCGATALVLHALPILAAPLRLAMANPVLISGADLRQTIGVPGYCASACISVPGLEMACDLRHDPLHRG